MEYTNLINTINAINELRDTPGKKDKEALIDKYKDNDLFVSILEFLCNTDKITGIAIKKLNKDIELKEDVVIPVINNLNDLLEFTLNNNTGSDKTVKTVQKSINSFPEETQDFLKQLITKKYKCGVTAKTLNKVIPGLIEEFNVMLAEKYKDYEKLLDGEKEFVVTIKLDGVRIILQKEGELILFKTRQGKKIEGLVDLEEEARLLPDGVYDGELIAIGTFSASQDMYKETMKRFAIKGDKTKLKMICFDYIQNREDFLNGYDATPFIERKQKLYNILEEETEDEIVSKYNFFKYHENVYVGSDKEEIKEAFKTAIEFGEEGLMINIADAPYEGKRTKNLLKYKEFNTADVLITDVIEGKAGGKFEGTLGSVTAECLIEIDGNTYHCISNVGGFSDEDRERYWNNPELIVGKIAEIEYFEITTNDKGTYSLRFAQWKDRIRIDKNTTHVD